MNWLSTTQACRRLNYRRRQLWRVMFAIKHKETPTGMEWSEESLQQFQHVLQTGTCPHCGYRANSIIRHLRRCHCAPDTKALITEYRNNQIGLQELALKYNQNPKKLRMRLLAAGVTPREIEARRRRLVNRGHKGNARCQNPACGILIFSSPNQLPSPVFEWRNHANIKGYCPACAVELGHVAPAEAIAILNRPLH